MTVNMPQLALALPKETGRFRSAAGFLPDTAGLRRRANAARTGPPFFDTRKPGPKQDDSLPGCAERRERAVALREERHLSVEQICAILAQERMPTSATAVNRMFREAGLLKQWCRTPEEREEARPERARAADSNASDLALGRFRTGFSELFLLAAELARCDPDGILKPAGMPDSAMFPVGCAFLSRLALKLRGIGWPSHVMAETVDEGLALFAGLNAIARRATLSDYSSGADPRLGPESMDRWHAAVRHLDVDLGEADPGREAAGSEGWLAGTPSAGRRPDGTPVKVDVKLVGRRWHAVVCYRNEARTHGRSARTATCARWRTANARSNAGRT